MSANLKLELLTRAFISTVFLTHKYQIFFREIEEKMVNFRNKTLIITPVDQEIFDDNSVKSIRLVMTIRDQHGSERERIEHQHEIITNSDQESPLDSSHRSSDSAVGGVRRPNLDNAEGGIQNLANRSDSTRSPAWEDLAGSEAEDWNLRLINRGNQIENNSGIF